MFNFTPLLGAKTGTSAVQSLLEFEGGVKILVDLGWGEDFSVHDLEPLESHVKSLSLILLTHATTSHLAAYVHCCRHFPSFTKIPVYATTPVISLGRTLLEDIYTSSPLAYGNFRDAYQPESSAGKVASEESDSSQILLPAPTLEEIANFFSLIHPLKYSQPHQPVPAQSSPPLNGLTITAYSAGHTLGGTIWHLQHGMESIVYAVDWNQLKENVLGGAAWLASGGGAEVIEQLRKPTALVCSAQGAERNPLGGGRKQRDDLLHSHIRTTIAKGGTVLIPSESVARTLELVYVLEHIWQTELHNQPGDNPFSSAKLYFASRTADASMRYVRSMLEWMDDRIVREFETAASNASLQQHHRGANKSRDAISNGVTAGPFDFRYLKLVERRSQLERILSRSGPRVIVATDSSLRWGFSNDILQRIATDPNSLVILTRAQKTRGDKSTLWSIYQERLDGVAIETQPGGQTLEQVYTGGRPHTLEDLKTIPLEGKELVLYQQYLITRRQSEQGPDELGLESSADVVDEASSTTTSSSEDSNPVQQGKALNASATVAHLNRNKSVAEEALGVNALLRQPGVYDYDVRGKKGREQMFPYVTKRRRQDDFGELIRPEDYLRAEERDEAVEQGIRGNNTSRSAELGQKRKWVDTRFEEHTVGAGMNYGVKRHKGTGALKAGADELTSNADHVDEDGDSDGELDESNSTENSSLPSLPSKLSANHISVELHLRLGHVDFSSLHDQRSLSMLLPLIQPQKLVLTCGSEADIQWLANDYSGKLQSATDATKQQVFTPSNGEIVDASVDTNAWTVNLSQSLAKELHWQNVRGLGVVTLTGHLAAASPISAVAENSQDRKRQKLLKVSPEPKAEPDHEAASISRETALPPLLDVIPGNLAAATRAVAQPLHVGELRLADLRKFLHAEGHTADFRGEGTLMIDDLVAVRKTDSGKIEVEGGSMSLPPPYRRSMVMEGPFHAVRRRIYEGLAVIAAG